MGFKSFMRVTFRLLGYIYLLSLPITFFPTLVAIPAGFLFARYHFRKVDEGVHALAREVDTFHWMNQWELPGAPISSWRDNKAPFFVPQVTSAGWDCKLGLVLPRAYHMPEDMDPSDEPGVDKLVSFEGALRDMRTQSHFPKEWWIFVSRLAMPEVFPWDAAFRDLLEYHSANPLPKGTAFAHIQCADSPFLCNVWQVYNPAMVHLLVREDGFLDPEFDTSDYDANRRDLRPVDVRIIDLGLQENVSTLVPNVFPSRFEQMKSLTTQAGAYSVFDEYDLVQRSLKLWQEEFHLMCNRRGSILDYLTDLENWTFDHIANPLGLEDALDVYRSIAVTLFFGTTSLINSAGRFIWQLGEQFLARPTEFDELAERIQRRDEQNAGGGLFGGMMQDFLKSMPGLLNDSSVEPAVSPAPTS